MGLPTVGSTSTLGPLGTITQPLSPPIPSSNTIHLLNTSVLLLPLTEHQADHAWRSTSHRTYRKTVRLGEIFLAVPLESSTVRLATSRVVGIFGVVRVCSGGQETHQAGRGA